MSLLPVDGKIGFKHSFFLVSTIILVFLITFFGLSSYEMNKQLIINKANSQVNSELSHIESHVDNYIYENEINIESFSKIDFLINNLQNDVYLNEDELKVIKNFIISNEYEEVIILDSEKNIYYSYLNNELIGLDSEAEINPFNDIINDYFLNKRMHLDPEFVKYSENLSIIKTTANEIILEDEVIAYVFFFSDFLNFNNYLENDFNINIINSNLYIISSNELSSQAFLVQKIINKNSNFCISNNQTFIIYENYLKGKEYGSRRLIEKNNWCITAGVSYTEILGNQLNKLKIQILIKYFFLFLTANLTTLIIINYLHKKNFKFYKKNNCKHLCLNKVFNYIGLINKIKLSPRTAIYSIAFYLIIVGIFYFNSGFNKQLLEPLFWFMIYYPNSLVFLYSFSFKNKIKHFFLLASLFMSLYAILSPIYHYLIPENSFYFVYINYLISSLCLAALILYILAIREVSKK